MNEKTLPMPTAPRSVAEELAQQILQGAIAAILAEYKAYGHEDEHAVQNTLMIVERAIHGACDVTGIDKGGIEIKYPPVN